MKILFIKHRVEKRREGGGRGEEKCKIKGRRKKIAFIMEALVKKNNVIDNRERKRDDSLGSVGARMQ